MGPLSIRPSLRIIRSICLKVAAVLVLALFVTHPGSAAEEWFTMNKDYSAERYVDLDQITPENVGGLREVCEVELNQPVFFTSGLVMAGGTLFVTTNRQTVAVDAATCAVRWRHVLNFNEAPIGASARGVGYMDGKVFRGTPDGRVMAFDATSGKLLWGVQAADTQKHEMFPSAPIVWRGKVFIGIAFSDGGIAGRLLALDAESGREIWRFNTTMGFNAGGGFWASYSLDPATGEIFGGVANPFTGLEPRSCAQRHCRHGHDELRYFRGCGHRQAQLALPGHPARRARLGPRLDADTVQGSIGEGPARYRRQGRAGLRNRPDHSRDRLQHAGRDA